MLLAAQRACPRGKHAGQRIHTHGKEHIMTRLSEIMTPEPAYIVQGESIRRAAELMADLDVGELPICDGRRLVGVITDRDITVRCTARGAAPMRPRLTMRCRSGPFGATRTTRSRWRSR